MRPKVRVDHIVRPVLRRDFLYTLINWLLQRDQDGVEISSETANRFNITAKLGEHRVIKIVAEHKRLTNHNPAVTFLLDFVKKPYVSRFIFFRKDSVRQFGFCGKLPPDVVNADENAEDVGFVVEAIPLPAVFEVANGVAGDASVNDVQVVSWVFSQEEIRDEMDVAEAEGLVVAGVPVGVGDTVADEENGLVGFQVELVFHLVIFATEGIFSFSHRGHPSRRGDEPRSDREHREFIKNPNLKFVLHKAEILP